MHRLALLMHRLALLMHRLVLLMHRLALLMHRLALLMHRLALLMHRLVLLMHRLALLMHRLALLMHRLAKIELTQKPSATLIPTLRLYFTVRVLCILACGNTVTAKVVSGKLFHMLNAYIHLIVNPNCVRF